MKCELCDTRIELKLPDDVQVALTAYGAHVICTACLGWMNDEIGEG